MGVLMVRIVFHLLQHHCRQIQQWLRTNRHITKDLPVKSMEHTLLADLSICLGQPYLYVHQGNCEHIIQFTDIRYVSVLPGQGGLH